MESGNDDKVDTAFDIQPSLYINQDGEAHFLPHSESCNTDYGLQNSISVDLMSNLLVQKTNCELKGLDVPNIMIIDSRFDYEFSGGHIQGAHNISTKEDLMDEFLGS